MQAYPCYKEMANEVCFKICKIQEEEIRAHNIMEELLYLEAVDLEIERQHYVDVLSEINKTIQELYNNVVNSNN